MIRVLFVCLGNICRSPTAHGVFRKMVADAGLSDKISIDSAGTAAWHEGKEPDARSSAHALKRNYDLSDLRARQAVAGDFSTFDYILAMDSDNLNNLRKLMPGGFSGHLGLMLEFGLDGQDYEISEVPDPYYDGEQGFELVLDLLERSCIKLLEHIKLEDLSGGAP